MVTGQQITDSKPSPTPPVVAGVSWSPRLQLQAYNFTEIGIVTLDANPQVICPANPDRQALIVEYISGSGLIYLRIGEVDSMAPPSTVPPFVNGQPIVLNAALQPGLPQLQWSACSLAPLVTTIRVWELVSIY